MKSEEQTPESKQKMVEFLKFHFYECECERCGVWARQTK